MPIWPLKRKQTDREEWVPSSVQDPAHPLYGEWKRNDGIIGRHLDVGQRMEAAYKDRDRDPKALPRAIKLCEQQIAMSQDAAAAFRWDYDQLRVGSDKPPLPIPFHQGFTQLAIVREKEGRFEDAAELCRTAKAHGWQGDWDKRIERLEKKATAR